MRPELNKSAFVIFLILCIILPVHLSFAEPDPNLVGWWKFDEGSGTTANDSAGDNNGTIYDATWITGRIDSALSFDGSNDYVGVPDNDNSLDIDNQITIAAWVKINNLSKYYFIVTKQPSGTAGYGYPGNYEFRIDKTSGYLYFLHQTGTGTALSSYHSTSAVTTGVWQHVAVTLEEGVAVKFYINGSPAGTSSQTTTFGIANIEPVRIGTRGDNYSYFYGAIDDTRIYNRALSDAEIQQLYYDRTREATNPVPANGASYVDQNVTLSWLPGTGSLSHDVYFGTNFDDVTDANTSDTTGIYRGRQDSNTYTLSEIPQPLDRIYYWRIDEVNDPNIWKGNVWSFTFTGRRALETVHRILSWNIEFLGTRNDPPRTQAQHDAIAQRILTFDTSVLALQEIYDGSVLEYIRSQLGPSWQIYYSGTENALLYDTNKVEMLSVEMLHNLSNPPYTDYPWPWGTPVSGIFRPVRMYAEPFRVIGVHCHWNDANIRAAEGSWLRDRIIEMLEDPDEPHDIILLGDLNGSPGSAPHPQLQEGNYLYLLPKENGDVTHVNGTSRIDHCYVTQDATDKLPKKSAFVIRPEYYGETPSQFHETYSDHYPIFIDFRPDAHTDFVDFAMFAAHWLETGCNLQNNWCGSADFTGDGQVDRADLCKFAEWWLAGM